MDTLDAGLDGIDDVFSGVGARRFPRAGGAIDRYRVARETCRAVVVATSHGPSVFPAAECIASRCMPGSSS
jgi:hypothetical protein